MHLGFHQAPPAISGATLPSDAAVGLDRPKMLIALGCAGFTENRRRARRNDHPRRGVSLQYLIVDRIAIVRAIGCYRTLNSLCAYLLWLTSKCENLPYIPRSNKEGGLKKVGIYPFNAAHQLL
jgi:hypothetical protein